MWSAKAVANEFINIAGKQTLSPMKLQKLVYFAHGWYLALTGEPLIQECVEAWQFGPVIPELYSEFKHYGSGGVTDFATEFDYRTQRWIVPRVEGSGDGDDVRRALKIIKQVWKAYGDQSAIKLSNVTHMPGTPWSEVYVPSVRSLVIPDKKIGNYFRSLASE